MPKTIEVTELILRDAHQSLMATRMALEDMIPACEDLDNAGYWSLECWGGATFDACIRFLNEDPWERLRTFKKLLPKTPLQMLLRGQNLLGYRHYEDDVVDRFVEKAAENGMDVFRVFDALTISAMSAALKAVKRAGKHAQGTICYTTSPVHRIGGFVETRRATARNGLRLDLHQGYGGAAEAGTSLRPGRGIKESCGEEVRIHVHAHATTGVTLVSLHKAIEAGADAWIRPSVL